MENIAQVAKDVQSKVAVKLAGFVGPDAYDRLPANKKALHEANRDGANFEFTRDEIDEMAEAVVAEALQAILDTVKKP